jgi:hypothetical protein
MKDTIVKLEHEMTEWHPDDYDSAVASMCAVRDALTALRGK